MTRTRIITLLLTLLAGLFSTAINAAEELNIDFTYERNVNIGNITKTISLPAFGDDRGVSDNKLITDEYSAQIPLAEIIHDAFAQGFRKGGVELVESDADMQIIGTVLAAESELVDRSGVQNIQLTIRTKIQLQSGGRTVWENTLFGRGRVPETEGMVAAVNASLTRMVRELFGDDYFVMEL